MKSPDQNSSFNPAGAAAGGAAAAAGAAGAGAWRTFGGRTGSFKSNCGYPIPSFLQRPTGLIIPDAKLGEKIRQTQNRLFLLTHEDYRNRIVEIFNDPRTQWRIAPPAPGTLGGEYQGVNGSDLLRLQMNGTFRSLYPGGNP